MNYTEYELSYKEWLFAIVIASFTLFTIGLIFFQKVWPALLFSLLSVGYPRFRSQELKYKRKEELTFQFKQALHILSSSLAAGKSIESAFQEAPRELAMLYPDVQTYIILEFKVIVQKLFNGEAIEKILLDLSERSGVEDIQSFTDVFVICKRTGGNLMEVMRDTANMISEKIAIHQEITVMIAQKKFESKVLICAPILFVAILNYTSSDYMAPLYEGKGSVIMLIAIIILVFCLYVSKRIMDIRL